MRLQNQVAIVTGAANNIGRAIARCFAVEGAKVLIADIQDEAGEAVAASIRDSGGEASFFHADVGTDDGNRGMVDAAVERYGSVTVLVNNAHWERRGSIEELSEEDWDASFDVLLKAPFLASKYAVPYMRAAGGGAILNLSSVHGFQVSPGYPTYETAKAALIQLTKQMALDLGNDGIRVNAIAPGAIPSDEMREENADDPTWHERNILWNILPIVGRAEDIAQGALYLCSAEARFVTGHTLLIDGGFLIGFKGLGGTRVQEFLRRHPDFLEHDLSRPLGPAARLPDEEVADR
jgi:NAD(P)-dependent dehydrogenase (short-subunit alcohol dehydrogenase family)